MRSHARFADWNQQSPATNLAVAVQKSKKQLRVYTAGQHEANGKRASFMHMGVLFCFFRFPCLLFLLHPQDAGCVRLWSWWSPLLPHPIAVLAASPAGVPAGLAALGILLNNSRMLYASRRM